MILQLTPTYKIKANTRVRIESVYGGEKKRLGVVRF